MPDEIGSVRSYLVVCLNPVIQTTLVFGRLAKGEVNRTSEYRVDPSGKGINAARVLGQVGRRAINLTQLGGPARDWFLAMCRADALELRWVESGADIRFCSTIVDVADRSATELVEEARPVAEGTAERILAEFDRILPEAATVMLSGTKAAGFPADIMPEMARRAAGAGKRIILDIKEGISSIACPSGPPSSSPISRSSSRPTLRTRPVPGGRKPGKPRCAISSRGSGASTRKSTAPGSS